MYRGTPNEGIYPLEVQPAASTISHPRILLAGLQFGVRCPLPAMLRHTEFVVHVQMGLGLGEG